MQIPAAECAGELGHADVVRKPVVIHRDPLPCESPDEVLLGHAAASASLGDKELPDIHKLILWDVNPVGVHPSPYRRLAPGAAETQHPPVIIPGHELPGSPVKVQADDPAFVIGLPECLLRRADGPHRDRPAHHPVLLGLHGPEMRHHFLRSPELRRAEMLREHADRDGIETHA